MPEKWRGKLAGDWIKLDHTTPDKPEVIQLAQLLGFEDHDLAFAKCVRLWIWADQQSVDGNELCVTDSFVDRYTRVAGFAAALRKVGWLEGRDGRLSIPNFSRHNGQSAKTRANTAKRVQKSRDKCNAPRVTQALPEKSREEKRNLSAAARAAADADRSLDFAALDVPQAWETACKLADALIKRRIGGLSSDWIWQHVCIGEVVKPGFVRDVAAKILEREIRKPKAYVERALAQECEARGVFLGGQLGLVPPKPTQAREEVISEELSKSHQMYN